MAVAATPGLAPPPRHATLSRVERHRVTDWYIAGALLAFAIPLIAVDLLELHHDLFLLVYFTVIGTFLASFAAHAHFDPRCWLRARLWWSVGVGAIVAFALVRKVMTDASMAHPKGLFMWFEVGWRGVLYGTMDALLLFVFPATVAYLLLRDSDRRRRLRFAGLTLLLSMGITASYHLGYPQFRGSDLVQPEIGAVVAWVPTALTGNPVGSVVVHSSYHVAANVHTYSSDIYLPPDLNGYSERGGGTAGLAVSGVWIVLAGGVIYLERRRLFPTQVR
ncbi:MAG TPA: hypothetical protein VJ831_00685 [Jatrophihabitantaceae bacterium]|nr:hypothetical protein [Jatrophihabitantaceae bacterium]